MQAMRILILTQPQVVNKTGGAITIFFSMCDMLVRNGYEVSAACVAEEGLRPAKLNPLVDFHSIGKDLDVSVNSLVEKCRPQLIIFFFHYLYTGSKLKKEFDSIPRILMFHSRPDIYFGLVKGTRRTLRKVYKNTTSQILFESYRRLLPNYISRGPVVVIPNSVALPAEPVDLNVEHKKIIYFSRVDRYKGCELLIDAFSLISKKYPLWSIDVYGEAETPGYLERLKSLTREKGIDGKFGFKFTDGDKKSVFKEYDYCVFPSFFEGFSIGLAEAMANGLPCVGFKSASGVNELIVDKKNGLLSDFSAESLAESMEILINDKQLRISMGKAARKTASYYSIEYVDNCWLSLIDRLAGGKIQYKLMPTESIIKLGWRLFKDSIKK